MPLDTTLDATAAALLGVIALEQILPLISGVRAANDEGYDADLRTVTLAWQLSQLAGPVIQSGDGNSREDSLAAADDNAV